MKDPPTSECRTANRCEDGRKLLRDDIRLDGERKHQGLLEEKHRC